MNLLLDFVFQNSSFSKVYMSNIIQFTSTVVYIVLYDTYNCSCLKLVSSPYMLKCTHGFTFETKKCLSFSEHRFYKGV